MYRSLPTDNKICNKRWVERCQRIHKEKLKQMKSTSRSNARPFLDNSAPKKYMHLVQNLKKAQLEEERFATIERENTLLLEKMSKIMRQGPTRILGSTEFIPGLRLDSHQYPVLDTHKKVAQKSLNRDYRKRELIRITEENQAILQRIQHKEPFYNHMTWEQERKTVEGYLRNICEYPYQSPFNTLSREYTDETHGEGEYDYVQREEMAAAAKDEEKVEETEHAAASQEHEEEKVAKEETAPKEAESAEATDNEREETNAAKTEETNAIQAESKEEEKEEETANEEAATAHETEGEESKEEEPQAESKAETSTDAETKGETSVESEAAGETSMESSSSSNSSKSKSD